MKTQQTPHSEPEGELRAKPTPGPWYWSREKIGDTWHCFLQGEPNEWNDRLVTAMRLDLAAFPYAIDTPNARLIAAAPDLLAAARGAIKFTCCASTDDPNWHSPNCMYRELRAAIAKAEGGA
jgi:hypothetical protein